MKTTISKLKYVFFLLVIAGFVSCKGEIGPPGADGADGIDGIDGTDGNDGNANVISSDWIAPVWSATNSIYGFYDYYTEDFTDDIKNTGLILSYCDWGGNLLEVLSVPFTYNNNNSNVVSFNFVLKPEKITWVFCAQSDFTPHPNMLLRYVIIPSSGSKSANSKQTIYDELEQAGVDINNYYEVMDYYGLDY